MSVGTQAISSFPSSFFVVDSVVTLVAPAVDAHRRTLGISKTLVVLIVVRITFMSPPLIPPSVILAKVIRHICQVLFR